MTNPSIAYLEDEFDKEWEQSGTAYTYHTRDASFTRFKMHPYNGFMHGSFGNNIFDLKDDIEDSFTEAIIPMIPIPSIPATVKEWEENTGEDWDEHRKEYVEYYQ